MRNRKLLLAFSVLLLSVLACTQVEISNQGDEVVTVLVELPDGGGTYRIQPSGSVTISSLEGGRYAITVIQNKEYVAELNRMQELTLEYLGGAEIDPNEEIGHILEGATKGEMYSMLGYLRDLIVQEQSNTGYCSGDLPETKYEDDSNIPAFQDVNIILQNSGSDWTCTENRSSS